MPLSFREENQFENAAFTYTDQEFDRIYPKHIQELSHLHWTPIKVAKIALKWLDVQKDTKILDIGSGVGKFCCLGALLTEGNFIGVEQRIELINISIQTVLDLNITNVNFIFGNITNIDFRVFDAFYYYNPFCEQITPFGAIDNQIELSRENYNRYENYVHSQLAGLKKGTRIVTYCSEDFLLPSDYIQIAEKFGGSLALWVKSK